MIRALDLFAGAGGLSLGMKEAGVDVIAAVEREKSYVDTLRHHLQDAELQSSDVRDLDLSRYRSAVDLVMGGPPCQPFSSGGLRGGAKDERDMLPHFMRAISTIRPQAFLMENVRGLVVGDRRYYFDRLISDFHALGYNITWRVLNAADYGVPQKRVRLFVVGTRRGVFTFPEPTHGPNRALAHVTVRDILPPDQVGEPNPSKVTYAKAPDLRPSPYHGQLFNGGGRPLNLDEPAPTILASAGGNKTHFIDTENRVPPYHSYLLSGGKPRQGTLPGARRLTIIESAIIQTFPRDLIFCGSRSSQYAQIGNAVPPRLAEVLGRSLVAHFRSVENGSYSDADGVKVNIQTSLF